MSQESLETVLDRIYAMRSRDIESVASRLDPAVVHQGVLDHLVCNGREEILQNMRGALQLFIVYTVQDGKIVRMDDYRTRVEVFTAAGLTLSDWK
jgi:hypothetical protein